MSTTRLALAWTLILLAAKSQGEDRKTLLSVHVLYRHGERTPVDPYPNDPYKDPNLWPVGFGQLTNNGKRMQYELGQFLRKRYQNFLSRKYNETEIYVRSTDYDRTLMSAMSNLAGLYPPVQDQIWNPDIMWQPIPVHTVSKDEDNILVDLAKCEKYDLLHDQLMASKEFQDLFEEYEWVFKYCTKMSGRNVTNLVQADFLADTLFIEESKNLTLPDWTRRVYPQPLGMLQELMFKVSTWTPEMARLRAGPLIKKIWEHLESVASQYQENSSFNGYKMIMYSGHDLTQAYLLNALGAFDPPIFLPYASCLLLELFHNTVSDEFEIRMLFRNETQSGPFEIPICGQEFCSLAWFDNYTTNIRPGDWSEECMATDKDQVTWTVSIFVAFLILAALIVTVSWVRRLRKTASSGYTPINNREN